MSLATSANRFMSGLVTLTLPVMTQALGLRGYFLFYAVLTLLSIVYLYYYLPETKGKTLEEVEDYFVTLAENKSRKSLEMKAKWWQRPLNPREEQKEAP